VKVGFFRTWIRAPPACSHVLIIFTRVSARRRGPQQLQGPLWKSWGLQARNKWRQRLAVSGRRGREGWGPRRGLARWPRAPQTVLCSSTRRKWWGRILRRRLCVDLRSNDTASVRLNGTTHDGVRHEQKAQSRCIWRRRQGPFFFLGLGEAYHWRSAQTRTVSSAAKSRYLSRRRRCPKFFVCPKRRGPPFSEDTRAASGDFVKGGPGDRVA
jgi:hypothetical protein